MVHKLFKKYKINQLQRIQQTYQYIYMLRYNDLTIYESIELKKLLKKFGFQMLILKQTLTNSPILTNGQGSLVLIYSNNNDISMISNLLRISNIECIFLKCGKTHLFSNKKLKQIFLTSINPLHLSLKTPSYIFILYLKKIIT